MLIELCDAAHHEEGLMSSDSHPSFLLYYTFFWKMGFNEGMDCLFYDYFLMTKNRHVFMGPSLIAFKTEHFNKLFSELCIEKGKSGFNAIQKKEIPGRV